MPWREVDAMSEKLRFVELASQSGINFSKLCQEFGISRTTGYKWLSRYQVEEASGLNELSRKPHAHPKTIKSELQTMILNLRDKYPTWGGNKIKSYYEKQGLSMPSEKTIDRILKKHGRISLEESLKRKAFIRFEHESPNDLWQMDFKGHFGLTNGKRCHPLTLLDDHSRYSLGIISCEGETFLLVKQGLIEVFKRYGLPKRMTMDNGAPWGYSQYQSHTRLTVWLIKQGIKVSHSRPYHPQTQGKLERFHRVLKEELINRYTFDNLEHAQEGFDWFRQHYNFERPHGAIKCYSPGYAYQPSKRFYCDKPKSFIYDSHLAVRKVNSKGVISYNCLRYFIGEGFAGEQVGLTMSEERQFIDVYFCNQCVLKLSPKQHGQ